MALSRAHKHQLQHFRAPCAAQRQLAIPRGSRNSCSKQAMPLEPIDSNEHSIRFKVLEEVPLVAVVERILENAAADAPTGDAVAFGRDRALELLQLGAVYVGIPQKGLDHIHWIRSLELPVAATAATLSCGHYIRVHPRPKRYPACYCADWERRVLHCDEEFVAVNKPAGLPCMRHESNAREELASCAGRALGLQGLEVCHRLDQWTTGVVVLSRTKEANKVFKRSLQERESGLVKTYKALTYRPVPLGPLEHHMYDGPFNEGAPVLAGGNLRPRGPRLLSRTAHERWRACRLDVRECKEHPGALAWYQQHFDGDLRDTAYGTSVHQHENHHLGGCNCHQDNHQDNHHQSGLLERQPNHQSSSPPASGTEAAPLRLYESTIDLHTGRTHQIRAQLASIGCPLVGDVMYTPIAGFLVDEAGVVGDPQMVSLVEQLPMLEGRIGLHAWRLSWRERTFTAQPEWDDGDAD